MPTYVYACQSCGARYEKREGFDAKPRQRCQECGKTANRVIHAPPIVFKGSGFYSTDNRASSNGASSDSTGGSKGDTAATETEAAAAS